METSNESHRRKTIRLPMAVTVTIAMQAVAILIWATQLDARVNNVEQQSMNTRNLNEKFARLEERLDDVKQGMGEIKQQIAYPHACRGVR